MTGADLIRLEINLGNIYSLTSNGNGYPSTDDESGNWNEEFELKDNKKIVSWTRNLNTGLEGDLEFRIGKNYRFLWAHGDFRSDGRAMRHNFTDEFEMTLSYDDSETDIKFQDYVIIHRPGNEVQVNNNGRLWAFGIFWLVLI